MHHRMARGAVGYTITTITTSSPKGAGAPTLPLHGGEPCSVVSHSMFRGAAAQKLEAKSFFLQTLVQKRLWRIRTTNI